MGLYGKKVSAGWCYVCYCAQEVDFITVIVLFKWAEIEEDLGQSQVTEVQKLVIAEPLEPGD